MPTVELKTVAEAAKLLRISARAVYQMCRRGDLGHFRVAGGRSVRIPQAAIEQYLKGRWVERPVNDKSATAGQEFAE